MEKPPARFRAVRGPAPADQTPAPAETDTPVAPAAQAVPVDPVRPTYEVGYGKPPKATRFQPGRSGNPKGRRKGRRNTATIYRQALDTKVRVNLDGRLIEVTAFEAAVLNRMRKAVGGDHKSADWLFLIKQQLEAEETARGEERRLSDRDQEAIDRMVARRVRNTEPEDDQ